MLSDAEWDMVGKKLRLTEREVQVLRGVFAEQTDDAIAIELGITPRTVRAHLEKLYRKCNCRTRCGAIVSAFKMFMIHRIPPNAKGPERASN
jgi:DNA-binding NarL/FixJ family response regulator